MKKSLLTTALLIPNFVFAAAQVNYLNVDGDTVHFSTAEAKTATAPQCAVAETNDKFAVSLNSEAGRAMYSLLVTAMASKQAVSVKSAQDCAAVAGVERAKGVSIVPVVEETVSTGNLSNSIIDNYIEAPRYFFKNHHGSQDYEMAFFQKQFQSPFGIYTNLIQNSRKQVLSLTDQKGWITAILSPECRHYGSGQHKVDIEIITDGKSRLIQAERQLPLNSGQIRYFIGLIDSSNGKSDNAIMQPSMVATSGKGIRFESSAEVWMTSYCETEGSAPYIYAGVNYILGGTSD